MILNSSSNMQVAGIVESKNGRKYYHAFADSNDGIPIMDRTIIIESTNGSYNILRIIPDEIVSILCNGVTLLSAISKFGNVYEYDGTNWKVNIYTSKPTRYIFKSIVHNRLVYSVCAGGDFLQFDKDWTIISKNVGQNNLKLLGVCNEKNNSFLVCGTDGILASVEVNKEVRIIDLPTNAFLLEVKKMQDNSFAVCGRKSTLFIGKDDFWNDYSKGEKVNFTSMEFWKERLYISAQKNVLVFNNEKYSKYENIRSLNLCGLKDELWSIALKALYKFDGANWDEVVIEIDTDQYKE